MMILGEEELSGGLGMSVTMMLQESVHSMGLGQRRGSNQYIEDDHHRTRWVPLYCMTRKIFYTCDVGEGGRRLRQTRLSFEVPDTRRMGGGTLKGSSEHATVPWGND